VCRRVLCGEEKEWSKVAYEREAKRKNGSATSERAVKLVECVCRSVPEQCVYVCVLVAREESKSSGEAQVGQERENGLLYVCSDQKRNVSPYKGIFRRLQNRESEEQTHKGKRESKGAPLPHEEAVETDQQKESKRRERRTKQKTS
jgi:hypothetical protein